MLSIKEGSYTVPDYIDYVAGNAWHCPTNFEPYASATMRTPLEVALGDHPYVRLGVNPTSGSDAPTKVELKYKAGTNSWETLPMRLETRGDGWQPKFDGNDYYTNYIPTAKFTVGMTVQYYFYLEYANSSLFATTSVGTTDQRGSIAYLGPNEAKSHPFIFTVVEPPPVGFNDPQGTPIEDPAVIEWLTDYGFTQADINALGNDYAALENFYKAYIVNYDFRVQGADASIKFTNITTVGDNVSVTVQLVRTAPLGPLHGKLYIYGARDLTDTFTRLVDTSVSFGETDETFDTQPTQATVTQTATATLSWISDKFFQAQIHAEIPDNGEW